MAPLKEQFILDNNGKKIGVFIDIMEYMKLLNHLEELEAITSYDKAIASGDEAIPFDQAIDEIEKNRL